MIRNWIDLLRVPDYYRIAAHIATGDIKPVGAERASSPSGEVGSEAHVSLQEALVVKTFGVVSRYGSLLDMSLRTRLTGLDPCLDASVLQHMPDFMSARGVRREVKIVCHGRQSQRVERFRFGSLLFVWGRRSKQEGILEYGPTDGFPTLVQLKQARILLGDGLLHSERKPALKAETVSVSWGNPRAAVQVRPGGPVLSWIRDYKESWFGGQYRGSRWSDMAHQWTSPIPGANMHGIPAFLANRCRGVVDPFSNQFFSDPTDEFCFLTEFQQPRAEAIATHDH